MRIPLLITFLFLIFIIGCSNTDPESPQVPDNSSGNVKCHDYFRNGEKLLKCAECGNGVCEPFEGCTASISSCSDVVNCLQSDDCGKLYCPKDCFNDYVNLGEIFTLHKGETSVIPEESLSTTAADFIYSPCPPNSACIWSGLAVVLNVTKGDESIVSTLERGGEVLGYRIDIVKTDYKTFAMLNVTKV